jgi:hypothetical protein
MICIITIIHSPHQRRIRVDLDRRGINSDFAPRFGFVRTSSAVTAVEFLSGRDVNTEVTPIPHQIGVHNVVLDHPPSENNDPRFSRSDCFVVDFADVGSDVTNKAGLLVGVEVPDNIFEFCSEM